MLRQVPQSKPHPLCQQLRLHLIDLLKLHVLELGDELDRKVMELLFILRARAQRLKYLVHLVLMQLLKARGHREKSQ